MVLPHRDAADGHLPSCRDAEVAHAARGELNAEITGAAGGRVAALEDGRRGFGEGDGREGGEDRCERQDRDWRGLHGGDYTLTSA